MSVIYDFKTPTNLRKDKLWVNIMKKKKFTQIRENITEIEYQKLLIYLSGKEDLITYS